MNNVEWLDSKDAALYLKISIKSLMNMCSNGEIPYYKLGRRNRYLKSELDKHLMSQKIDPESNKLYRHASLKYSAVKKRHYDPVALEIIKEIKDESNK